MSDSADERPRPTSRPSPQPRSGGPGRPSPRPRVAGSRRDRDDAADVVRTPAPGVPQPSARKRGSADAEAPRPRSSRGAAAAPVPATRPGRRLSTTAVALAVLCVLAAAGTGVLLWQRLNPSHVDTAVLSATRSGVEALYAYDYRDSEGSVANKLAVLTGELREQYEADLSRGGILDTYEQVSATTSYEVVDVALQRINETQDSATLVVFGRYLVKSATTGEQAPPEGSECEVHPDGGQACTQTVQVGVVQVDGVWKIDELTLLTTS